MSNIISSQEVQVGVCKALGLDPDRVRRIVLDLDATQLRDALAFPEDANIVDIQLDFMRPNVFLFKVEHPSFPETKEGEVYREIALTFTADYTKKPSTWISCDWNI